MDYECERGAKRNFEPWREAKLNEETEEQRLDRLEREEAERDAMKELETKVLDAKQEMAIADALDEIRSRNARIARAEKDGIQAEVPVEDVDEVRKWPDIGEEVVSDEELGDVPEEAPAPVFVKKAKEKKNFGAALGIKKKVEEVPAGPAKIVPPPAAMGLLAGYDSDDD